MINGRLSISDMNKKMLTAYGILKGYDEQNQTYEWAQRANIVIDKNGVIQHIEEGDSAVDPNNALTMCTKLHSKPDAKYFARSLWPGHPLGLSAPIFETMSASK